MTSNPNQPNSPLNHKLAAGLSIVFGLWICFVLFTKPFFDEHHRDFHEQHGSFYEQHINFPMDTQYVVMYFFTGIITFYLLSEFCFWLFRKNRKNRKKYFLAFFGTVGVAIPLSIILSVVALAFFPEMSDNLHIHMIGIGLKGSVGAAVIVFLSTLAISIFTGIQQTRVENQRLAAENIRNRYEALKHQLDPHFLFNSLNTLDGLIGFDDDKARQYLQNLSSTFRYTIQNKEITTLKDELNFVASYAYLMNIRYGDNLNIQYAVNEKYNTYYIMPVSLQMLLENAIKHNVINDKRPLTIHIETTENDTIKVCNTIQPKINIEAGEGIGLANLVERYHLLFGMDVVITKTDVFAVEIPLIKNYGSRNR